MASELKVKLWTRILVSVTVLLAGLYIILSGRYTADTIAWASGIVGVVVGYWLR